jgi:predicted GNAT family N-acyltransferase
MIHIEQIRPELTWRLRQRILHPTKKLYEMEMEEDNNGVHFGAFREDNLVGIASLFQKGSNFQVRKFAIDIPAQNMGIGKSLLNYIVDYAIIEGAERIWCNSRSSAIGFYSKSGFLQTGIPFSKSGIDYVIMEKLIHF